MQAFPFIIGLKELLQWGGGNLPNEVLDYLAIQHGALGVIWQKDGVARITRFPVGEGYLSLKVLLTIRPSGKPGYQR